MRDLRLRSSLRLSLVMSNYALKRLNDSIEESTRKIGGLSKAAKSLHFQMNKEERFNE